MERSFGSAIALVGHAAGPVSQHLGSFIDLLIHQQFVAAVVYVKALHAVAFDRCPTTLNNSDRSRASALIVPGD